VTKTLTAFVDNSINEWRRRIEAVIKNGGGHIEHKGVVWGWKNFTFTHHKFLLVTVKEWLKSVQN